MHEKVNSLTLNIHDKPKNVLQWSLLSFQHLFAMFGSTVLVPFLIGLPISVAIFCSGIATLIYIICTKGGSPVYLGSSFAFILPLIAAKELSLGAPFEGVIIVGLVYVCLSLIVSILGTKWFNYLLPPVVIGPTIIVIGLGLSAVAVSNAGFSGKEISLSYIAISLITMLTAILSLFYGKGYIKLIPILLAIIIGYITALILGEVNLKPVKEASFFEIPQFIIPFINYTPQFRWELIALVVPVSLVTIAEHVGDHVILSSIVNKNLINNPGLQKTLLGDGLATIAAGFLGGPVNTTYAENTGVIALTKIASVYIFITAAILAICVAFLGKFTTIVQNMPSAIMGGISIILFGLIALNGVRVLVNNKVDLLNNRNIIIIAIILVIGIGGATIPLGEQAKISGMTLATLSGIILNLILPKTTTKNLK